MLYTRKGAVRRLKELYAKLKYKQITEEEYREEKSRIHEELKGNGKKRSTS